MAKIARILLYESTDERMKHQLEKSLEDGLHQFGDMIINIISIKIDDLPKELLEKLNNQS